MRLATFLVTVAAFVRSIRKRVSIGVAYMMICLASSRGLATATVVLLTMFANGGAAAAEPTKSTVAKSANSGKAWKAPRTADGQPDLQGVWNNATITPFERPEKFGTRLVLSDAEVAELEGAEAEFKEAASAPTDPKLKMQDLPTNCGKGFTGANCGYNNFWVDSGSHVIRMNGEPRSSMVTDPATGRMPAVTAEAQQRMAARRAAFRGVGFNDGPEVRSLGERCLLSFGSSAGPPMIPLMYNNNYQIVQSKDTVVILVEMVHDARIVRINGKHKPASVKQWLGDSIGRYEGDTLVVETKNVRREQGFRGASENATYIERFTRISPYQIKYEFQVVDPSTWEKPWGGEVAMNATPDNIYEYACHEGNYALPGILAGAREDERVAAEKAKAAAK
jgi:hypothetical protein